MTQTNPQVPEAGPKQKFFRTPVQKLGCRTYDEAKKFATKAFEAAEKLNPGVSKVKVFARNNGLYDAVLYVDKAKTEAQAKVAEKKVVEAVKANHKK